MTTISILVTILFDQRIGYILEILVPLTVREEDGFDRFVVGPACRFEKCCIETNCVQITETVPISKAIFDHNGSGY